DAFIASDLMVLNGEPYGYQEVDLHNGKYTEDYKTLCYDVSGSLIGIAGFNRDITDRKKLYDALAESERSKSTLLSNLPGVAYRCENNEDWRMTFLSEGCYVLTGYKPEELLSGDLTYYDLIVPEYKEALYKKWREDIDCNRISTDEYPIRTASGKIKWVWEQSRGVYDPTGKPLASEGFITDITDNIFSDRALKQSEERFRTIFEKSQIGIGIFDSITGQAYHVNNRFSEILGRTKEELLRIKWKQYSHPEDIEENLHKMSMLNEGLIDSFSLDKRFIKPDGTIIWTNLIATPFDAAETTNPCHLCMINDITAQKLAEEETVYLNYHDQLTGLYNRRFYDEELKRLDTERNLPISLVMADVNGLKLTNDAFGHMAGDQMLKRIAAIMKQVCRSDDIVARIGGDEFILLLPRTNSLEAESIVNRINDFIQKEKWGNIIFSVSFGSATKKVPSEDMKKIYMLAEDRMYRDKLSESRSMRYETIKIIRETLFQKNKREQLHCERVSQLCEAIGTAMGFGIGEVMELKTAGLLHDIGKIGIEENLLNKTGSLSHTEMEDMKRHPEIGYHILSSVNEFAAIAEYVLCHHERLDGKGYPRNLHEFQIPIQSKIISIADSYDAMTSERSYKKSMTTTEAIQEIRKNIGSQFDQEIAAIFIQEVLKKN
ncbi:MAG: HD domain-containing phosphohydrolase, partial [Bacillota bacterium]